MSQQQHAFSGADHANGYAAKAARLVPGLADMHRMVTVLLAERVPADGRVLVLGAGGGMELAAFAISQPGWRFEGVDPSADMLAAARAALGPHAARVDFREGYVEDASDGPFDGATCLMTLHFLPAEERQRTVREIHRRLKPGAPLVVAHHSVPDGAGERDRWLARSAAFAIASGVPAAQASARLPAMRARLPLLPPDRDVALLREAGFTEIELFYAGFTFRGWVATRS